MRGDEDGPSRSEEEKDAKRLRSACTGAQAQSQPKVPNDVSQTLKTLTSLKKEVRQFFNATIALVVFPLLLSLAITALGGPEGCSFIVPKYIISRRWCFLFSRRFHWVLFFVFDAFSLQRAKDVATCGMKRGQLRKRMSLGMSRDCYCYRLLFKWEGEIHHVV